MEGVGHELQFQQYVSSVDFTFWHELTRRKLDQYKLDESAVLLKATVSTRAAAAVGVPCQLRVSGDSFEGDVASAHAIVVQGERKAFSFKFSFLLSLCLFVCLFVVGSFINTNTSESFVALDRKALLEQTMASMVRDAQSVSVDVSLQRFVCICFAGMFALF
jgi:ubiquitin-like modifier-activating enzyme ATG7